MQPKAARNIPIEALRLVAVAGIAVFHTFQWTFQAVCVGAVEYVPLATSPYSGVLGFINLLGCWANEVFFMISGYFLIASAARTWDGGTTWKSQMQRTAQRLGKVILPSTFYCLVALAWSTVVSPIPDVTLNTHYWYTLALSLSGSMPPRSSWHHGLDWLRVDSPRRATRQRSSPLASSHLLVTAN